jgi:DNA replication ATP-dependent helicase Dna2
VSGVFEAGRVLYMRWHPDNYGLVWDSSAADFIGELRHRIHAERSHGLRRMEELWALPLDERVKKCRAIGPLRVVGREEKDATTLVHFDPSQEDCAMFREGDRVRVSRNDPAGIHQRAVFHGLTHQGLTIAVKGGMATPDDGWTLDEDFVDLSEYYLAGLESLRSNPAVLAALTGGELDEKFDDDTFAELYDSTDGGLNNSQRDAVASCVASYPLHLVQGPPGTGKTHVLAMTAAELVKTNHRILVTAFTHRAIHHALRKIRQLVDCPVFKISDDIPHDREGVEIVPDFAATGLVDHPGPYVLGVTPISLFTSRAKSAAFDIALIDETSQMRVEAAVLPMLRARKWLFFGDHQQLPPVVTRPVIDAREDSVFACLAARGQHMTRLCETYRMNGELTRWPSENFYQGELESAGICRERRFVLHGTAYRPELGTSPSLIRIEIAHHDRRASSDEEAQVVLELIEQCLNGGMPPEEIGVVVPFRAQAAKIRRGLRFRRFATFPGIRDLGIDTVERFQGQEREIIIVSFTASDREFMARLAGFLTQPQRLNVAVTRARSKVVLVHSAAFRSHLQSDAPHDGNAALALSLLDEATLIRPWQG